MADVNLALTAAGQALRAKIELGQGTLPLEITRIVTGAGTDPDPINLSAVVDEQQEFTITSRVTTGPRTSITASVSNYGNPGAGIAPLATGYPISQIGFYANDPDDGEILYRISQFDTPNWAPAASERGWTFEPTFNFVTGNASQVIVQIDPSGLATKQDIWSSVEYTQDDTPNPGVKTHYRTTADAPGYQPAQPSARFRSANIAETRITDDPSDTANSPYDVALPATVIQAIYDMYTGDTLTDFLGLNNTGQIIIDDDEAIPTDGTAGTGTLVQLLGRLVNLIKQIIGGPQWWQAPESNITDHVDKIIFSVEGVHGLRYYNDTLQGWDGSEWVNVGGSPAVKSVYVGSQVGAMTEGEAGTVTFPVATEGIPNGNYNVTVANLPTGVTVQGQVSIAGNIGTLTLAGDTTTTAGAAGNLSLTINAVSSPAFTLIISEPYDPNAQSGFLGASYFSAAFLGQ